MISLAGVTAGWDGKPVLDELDLTLGERRIGIVGANGSGKSTLARLLNGLILPTRGEVRVDGLSTATDGAEVRKRVGFVFQNPDSQIVFPSVAEDLAFGLRNQGMPKADCPRHVREILDLYGLAHLEHRPTYRLSGGEKQMIALLGVLVMGPAYIVLDEPTTLLDRRNARALARTLDALEQTLIVITHDLDLIAGFERVICLHEGKVHADGPAAPTLDAYKALFP